MTSIQQLLAKTWDEAYSEGYACGEMRGFALGWDAAMKEEVAV